MEVSGEENRVGQMGGGPRLRHEDLRSLDNSGGMNRQRTGCFGMDELVEQINTSSSIHQTP